jgi:predicted esterase
LSARRFVARPATASVLFLALGSAVACAEDGNAPGSGGAGSVAGASTGGAGTSSGATSGGATAGSATAGGSTAGGSTGGTSSGGDQATGGAAQSGGSSAAGQAAGGAAQGGSGGAPEKYVPISFGTSLDPALQMAESQKLAQSLANSGSPSWRAKGDQHRTYRFAEANQDVAYRVCVPTNWDGASKLPLVMFLHGAGNDESSYLDQNNKQMVTLAQQHGYVLVSPLGYGGAYGNFLRLPADFSKPDEATKMLAMRTAQTEKTQEISEKDVINVLELVLNEYPIDRTKMFLTGHSMGSGGTWYIGGKYSTYWAALAPMSGPFVLEKGYPWEHLRDVPLFVTEGLSAATVSGSRALRDWAKAQGFELTYKEVSADHAGMVPLVLPDVFTFFDEAN